MSSTKDLSELEQKCLIEMKSLVRASGYQKYLRGNAIESRDEILLRFIRARKYDSVSAFDRFAKLVKEIKNHPEVFNYTCPSAVYPALNTYGGNVLKSRDSKGHHVLILRVSTWDPELVQLEEIGRADIMLGWEMLSHKETQLNGMIIIVDGRTFGYKHAGQLTPSLAHRFAGILFKGSPLKIKALHLVYGPRLLNMSWKVIKMFLPSKIRDRTYIHGDNIQSLHEFVSADILPDWLGGSLSSEEAIDYDLYNALYSKEKEDYYKSLWVQKDLEA